MPPEKCAYALARYSRSADSIRQSIDWVRSHNSQDFLESFYFQYGHQSIADLGHTVLAGARDPRPADAVKAGYPCLRFPTRGPHPRGRAK